MDSVQAALSVILNNLNFFSYSKVQDLINQVHPIIWGLLTIGIIFLGLLFLVNRQKEKSQIPLNVLLFMMIVLGLPTFLNQLNNLTVGSLAFFSQSEETSRVSQTLLKNGIQDLMYFDQNGFSSVAIENGNNIPVDRLTHLDPVELINPGDATSECFGYSVSLDTDGATQYKKLSDGFLGWDLFSSYYYRYKIDWFSLLLSLGAMALSLFFTCVKSGKLIFEIAYDSIFLLLTAPLDLSTGQRMKKILTEIASLFLVFISIALAIRLYILGVAWVSDTFEGLPLALVLLGFSMALMDGPNIVQKILGIDAGLSSALQSFSGIYYAARTITQGAKGLAHVAGGVAKGAAAVGGYTAGKAAGVYSYHKAKPGKPMPGHQQDSRTNEPVYDYMMANLWRPERIGAGEPQPQLTSGSDNSIVFKPASDTQIPPKGSGPSGAGAEQKPPLKQSDQAYATAPAASRSYDSHNSTTPTASINEGIEPGANHSEPPGSSSSIPAMDVSGAPNTSANATAAPGQTSNTSQSEEYRSDQPEPSQKRDSSDHTTTLASLAKNRMQNSLLSRSFQIGRNTAIESLQKRDEYAKRIKDYAESKRQTIIPPYSSKTQDEFTPPAANVMPRLESKSETPKQLKEKTERKRRNKQ